ncbi:MAG: preprotein translocase subunit SecE [Clostridia bacterium]|nr:preprotein translocase subunit SecE [Clostridia bacterium]
MVLTGCAIAFVVFSIITIFVNDYAEVLESDGAKKPLVKRFVSFIREYKSEIKKIRWPDIKTVVKNTIIVLIVCAVVGAFIWVLDFGLGNLIKWLFA